MDLEEIPIVQATWLCIEVQSKCKNAVQGNKSVESCSNKYIRLNKRFYDAARVHQITFAKSIDIVASKAMLHLARACFLNAHVLQHFFKLDERSFDKTFLSKVKTTTGRFVQKTLGRVKEKYPYSYPEEEYLKHGIGFIWNEDTKKRKFYDEVTAVSISLKSLGNRLVQRVENSGLVTINQAKPERKFAREEIETLLRTAYDDVRLAYNILALYFDKIEKIIGKEDAILAMCVNVTKESGIKLLADVTPPTRKTIIVDVHDTLSDVKQVSRLIDSLPDLIEGVRTRAIPEH